MRAVVFPYKLYSEGAKALADALHGKRVRAAGTYRPKRADRIINWGNGQPPVSWRGPMLNPPEAVARAINKRIAFERMKAAGVRVPEFTPDRGVALRWLTQGATVLARQSLTGTRGNGIVVMENAEQLVPAPLYTQYKKKKQEFRVHVMNGQVFDAQEKRKRRGAEADNFVRSERNGWVFCRDNVNLPADVSEQAVAAVAALGLDFGGVDVIWNVKEQKAYVLEVNTAPGLEGTTVTNYANAFQQYLR